MALGSEGFEAQSRSTVTSNGEKRESIQVVEFVLGKEHYAIDLFDVKEVVEYTSITRLPNTPAYILGIIDLRGEITTILDLKHRLSISETEMIADESSRIIVLDDRMTRSKVGILVDDVTSVSTFEANQVDYASTSMNREETAIIGILKRRVKLADKETTELIIWIDIRALLRDIMIIT
jgi:purine-binding chemotaxis protein CheW